MKTDKSMFNENANGNKENFLESLDCNYNYKCFTFFSYHCVKNIPNGLYMLRAKPMV